MKKGIHYISILAVCCLFSCTKDPIEELPDDTLDDVVLPERKESNVLLIIADDIGLDAMNGYQEGSIKPNTPHLDQLRLNGLKFNNFWTNSVCSPTRASILTGQYGYRNGVRTQSDHIPTDSETLHSYIKKNSNSQYSTALIGKWHLFGGRSTLNPETMGIDHFSGMIGGGVGDYYNWSLYEDGVSTMETTYVTSKLTDLAVDWIDTQTDPWFLWLAYNAPHTPFHLPPADMHSQGALSDDESAIDNNPLPYYLAAIEAMDFEIGRLMESMDESEKANTTIIFIGDNGTPGQVAQSPYARRKAKGSLYQGGVNCPMIVSGANVTRIGEEDRMVNSTDLFATIARLSDVDVESIHDSKSFSPLLIGENTETRSFTYAEYKDDSDDEWTIRNDQYKLIISNGTEELYNLHSDPYEQNDLLLNTLEEESKTNRVDLLNLLKEIRA